MTGGTDPLTEFVIPALSHSSDYWRASGYFSSSIFDSIGGVMEDFVKNDGKMDLVTSVHLSEKDRDAIESGHKAREELVEKRLREIIEKDFTAPLPPGVVILARLLEAKRLNIKIATTESNKLFHIKMGVFHDEHDDYVSFSGSQNESKHSAQDAFEGIDVYPSWGNDASRARKKREFFERLWRNEQPGAKVHSLPESLCKVIIKKYRKTLEIQQASMELDDEDDDDEMTPPAAPASAPPPPPPPGPDGRYAFQERAGEWFVDPEGANGTGLYWMATGTGKTITAFKTINRLFEDGLIDHVVINTKERLLHQWIKEMRKNLPGTGEPCTPWKKREYWQTSSKKDMTLFRQHSVDREGHLLLITYSFLPVFVNECIMSDFDLSRTLIVVDEVHNIGSDQNQDAMTEADEEIDESLEEQREALRPTISIENSNRYHQFGYRLGLSATPMSDFDDNRNRFILNAFTSEPPNFTDIQGYNGMNIDQRRRARIDLLTETPSRWAFFYGLEEAISDGILVPFEYISLPYQPTQEEEDERLRLMKYWKARVADGTASPAAPAIHMARVYKKCPDKLRAFRDWLSGLTLHEKDRSLRRALIFVDNTNYGNDVLNILFEEDVKTHKFFSGDDENIVVRFSEGELDNLITCHMISEGLDIESVSSIILFSSDRQRLETIQRIGRALRRNPQDPNKVAQILDFVFIQQANEDTSDAERYRWLSELGQ